MSPSITNVKDPLSIDGIKTILRLTVSSIIETLDDDAIELIQQLLIPLDNELKLLNNKDDVIEMIKVEFFIQRKFIGEIRNHVFYYYKNGYEGFITDNYNTSSIIAYLITEIIELADKRRITMRDIIIAVENDQELLFTLGERLPIYVNIPISIPKDFENLLISESLIALPNREIEEDYKVGLHNLAQALINFYGSTSFEEINKIVVNIAIKGGRGNQPMNGPAIRDLQNQVISTVLAYSILLKPIGEFTYGVLLKAVLLNPYLSDIPILQIVQQYSETIPLYNRVRLLFK